MKRVRDEIKSRHHRQNKKIRVNRTVNNYIYKNTDKDSDSDDDADYSDNSNNPKNFFFAPVANVTSKDNEIYFRSGINNQSVDKLIDLITDKNIEFHALKQDPIVKKVVPKPIYLYITSFGGSVLAGMRAVDAIIRSDIPIYTVVDGHAASAATFMSIVGKKRFMTPHSYMLIHQLSTVSMGKYWEIHDDYKNCTQFMDDMMAMYVQYTKMSKEELEELLKHDQWWTIEKCKEKGLIDESLDKRA